MHYTYLIHAGTKGMKWYQRLYRNYDGSLTEAGKLRYGYSRYRNNDGSITEAGKSRLLMYNYGKTDNKPVDTRKLIDEWVKKDRASVNSAIKGTKSGLNAGSALFKQAADNAKSHRAKADLSGFSNQELKELKERIQLENQVQDLLSEPTKAEKGFMAMSKLLDFAAPLTDIAASAYTIANALDDYEYEKSEYGWKEVFGPKKS